jgi:hypothetical protein
MHRVRVLSRLVLTAALVVHALMALFVIAVRIRYPHDLEWMTGSLLDHVERVHEGKPLYTAPTARWIPFLYPPLFAWLGATFGGGAFACRMLSLVASIVQGALVWRASRSLAATRFWAAIAVLVFVAAFPFVGFWYDLERSDNLFGAVVLAGAVVLLRARSLRGHVAAGLLFALATLAKQQAVFYLVGAGAGLVVATRASDEPTRRRDVVAFVGAAALPLVALFGFAHLGEGWAAYYLIRMPAAHGMVMSLAPGVFARDVPSGFLLVGVTLAVAIVVALRSLRRNVRRGDAVAAAILATGFAAAIASRLHIGGWINVLIPWTTCAAVAVGVVASRVEERWNGRWWVATVVSAVIVSQLVLWTYDPRSVVPNARTVSDEARLRAEVEGLERGGEVLLPGRGHLTRVRHFHISALADLVRVEGHSPPDLVRALRERAYAAIVDDAHDESSRPKRWPPTTLEEIDDLRTPLLSSYFIARRIDYARESLVLGAPAAPRWVYRPRRVPLDVDLAELRRRQSAEMHLAEARATSIARGQPAPFAEADIEDLAAQQAPTAP